jgi:hypothetical protein
MGLTHRIYWVATCGSLNLTSDPNESAVFQGPEGRVPNGPAPGGLGNNPENDPSAVGAAPNLCHAPALDQSR